MFIRLTKVSIAGKGASGDVILNTDYLSQLRVNGTGAEFLYMEQPYDNHRARIKEWVVEETVATIRNVINTGYSDNIVSLDIFPNNDITKSTYRAHYQIREIVKIYPYAANRDYSWVLMGLGFKLERLLVDNYWLDFLALAKTGSTSTTTSSTSTTSSSSTSTTCTPTTSTTSTSSSTTTTIP